MPFTPTFWGERDAARAVDEQRSDNQAYNLPSAREVPGCMRTEHLERSAGYNLWTGGPYDIEADWILMSTCNYRCQYCFWDTEELGRKINPPASPDVMARFFDRTRLMWLLHLTGGEPFHYPKLVELCRLLTRHHVISLNTNADSPKVREFARTIDPARVDFINCGVHVVERDKRRRVSQFLENVHMLKNAGFHTFVSCVMYPPLFSTFPQIWDWWEAQGLPLIPKALQGRHLGRSFPAGYTEAERALFLEYSSKARAAYAKETTRVSPPTIDPLRDPEIFFESALDFRGQLCQAGHHFVRIRENGDIRRCGPRDVIGNVVEGWFDRRPGPSPCAEIECPYFCHKYRVRAESIIDRGALRQGS
jgi:MoaA/NifB/PqqE/SkfB family radical SAM enzyme